MIGDTANALRRTPVPDQRPTLSIDSLMLLTASRLTAGLLGQRAALIGAADHRYALPVCKEPGKPDCPRVVGIARLFRDCCYRQEASRNTGPIRATEATWFLSASRSARPVRCSQLIAATSLLHFGRPASNGSGTGRNPLRPAKRCPGVPADFGVRLVPRPPGGRQGSALGRGPSTAMRRSPACSSG